MFLSKGFEYLFIYLAVWPPGKDSSRLRKASYTFLWWFHTINTIFVLSCVAIKLYQISHDLQELLSNFSGTTVLSENLISYLVIKYYEDGLLEMLNTSKEIEAKVQTKAYSVLYRKTIPEYYLNLLILAIHVAVVCQFILKSYTTDFEEFPFPAWYPRSASLALRVILLVHQIIAIYNVYTVSGVDALAVEMMYYINVRLDMLKMDYKCADTQEKLSDCIIEHETVIRFIEKYCKVFRVVITKLIIAYSFYFIGAGFCVFNSLLFSDLFNKLLMIIIMNSVRIYVFAKIADNLLHKHSKISFAIYDTMWYKRTKDITSTMIIIMQRCQKPLTITYVSFLPNLNIEFFSKYLSRAFSWLMALRTVVSNMEGL